MKKIALVISCEHAVDTVPKEYLSLFLPFRRLLVSHRGIDFGALVIAQHLKESLSCDLLHATATRLLIDCNRSLNHPHCFSEVTKKLSLKEKQVIIDQYYLPFRQQIIAQIKTHHDQGFQVWHLSIHSFTPVMNNVVRHADIGLLYDPQCSFEKSLAKRWRLEIKKQAPKYIVRMNYPYRGISDGFTQTLRKVFSSSDYLGIEVESNQALTYNETSFDTLKNILLSSLLNLLC